MIQPTLFPPQPHLQVPLFYRDEHALEYLRDLRERLINAQFQKSSDTNPSLETPKTLQIRQNTVGPV